MGIAVFAALAVFVAGVFAGDFVPAMRRVGMVTCIAVFAADLVGSCVTGFGVAGSAGQAWMSRHAALPFLPETLPECLPVALAMSPLLIGRVAGMWAVLWRRVVWLVVDIA